MMSNHSGCIAAIVIILLLWGTFYMAISLWPYVPTGEGPWRENYR